MAQTYDPTLSTTRDWVRFLIGDTGPNFVLTDEEIDALIAESPGGKASKYCAAAHALAALQSRWSSQGLSKGVLEKQVSRLRIRYGAEENASTALQNRIRSLRAQCKYLSTPRPRILATYPKRRC